MTPVLIARRAHRAMLAGSVAAWMAALAGWLGLDAMIADATAADAPIDVALGQIVDWLDVLALKDISNFLLGFALIIVAGALLALRHRGGWPLLYIGLVQFLTTTIADLSKPLFGRRRPYEAMPDGDGLDQWFAGGQSFPSGHTAFYTGLFVPLILLFPRYTLLWIIVPSIVAAQRMLAHDHYLSDVMASAGLATLLGVVLAGIARRRI